MTLPPSKPGDISGGSGFSPPHPADMAAPNDREEIYYEGSPSLKGELGTVFVHGLIGLVLVVAAFAAAIHWGGKLWLIAIAALLVGSSIALWPALIASTTRYKITNYRIDFERGLLSKKIDTLELWHVEDIQFAQSLANRILKVGSLIVVSHDDTTPSLTMTGLPEPRRLFDLLKQRVISVKRSRGVLKVDA